MEPSGSTSPPQSNRAAPLALAPDLAGRVALVTGGARGVGAAIVRALVSCGADIGIHYRSSRGLAEALADEVREKGGRAEIFAADLADATQARGLIREVASVLGGIDCLVYNVGPFLTTPLLSLSEPEWDEIFTTNLKSAWMCASAAAPFLRRSGSGQLIHISANSAFVRTHSVYGLAKAGLIHLTETLAIELGPEVTVNCIAPGMVEGSEPDTATLEMVLERTPLARLVTAEEIAGMCALLCSPSFASVTGRTIVMDGGRWIR